MSRKKEMVNYKGSSHSKTSSISSRRSSLLSITLYLFILFAFSILIFIFSSKDILEDEEKKPLIVSEVKSKSEQVNFVSSFQLW